MFACPTPRFTWALLNASVCRMSMASRSIQTSTFSTTDIFLCAFFNYIVSLLQPICLCSLITTSYLSLRYCLSPSPTRPRYLASPAPLRVRGFDVASRCSLNLGSQWSWYRTDTLVVDWFSTWLRLPDTSSLLCLRACISPKQLFSLLLARKFIAPVSESICIWVNISDTPRLMNCKSNAASSTQVPVCLSRL